MARADAHRLRQMRAFGAARPMHEDTAWLLGRGRITDGVASSL